MIVHLAVTITLSRSNVLYTLASLLVSKLQLKDSKALFIGIAFASLGLQSHLPLILLPLLPIMTQDNERQCSFKLLAVPLLSDIDIYVVDVWRLQRFLMNGEPFLPFGNLQAVLQILGYAALVLY